MHTSQNAMACNGGQLEAGSSLDETRPADILGPELVIGSKAVKNFFFGGAKKWKGEGKYCSC